MTSRAPKCFTGSWPKLHDHPEMKATCSAWGKEGILQTGIVSCPETRQCAVFSTSSCAVCIYLVEHEIELQAQGRQLSNQSGALDQASYWRHLIEDSSRGKKALPIDLAEFLS